MRALGFGTKVLAVCSFAALLVLTLGLSWYGPAPVETVEERRIGELHGPLDGLIRAIPRWLGEFDGGTTGWQALGVGDMVIAGCAVLAALCALLAIVPAVEHAARALLRGAVLVALGATVVALVDTPGPNAEMEPRYGIFAALAAATMLAISGFGLAAQRLRATARAKPAAYTAPPPPPEWQDPVMTSAPPPRTR